MGLVNKLKNIIGRNKEVFQDITWDVEFQEDKILLIPSIDIYQIDEIKDILNMYELDYEDTNIALSYDDIYKLYYDDNNGKSDIYKNFNLPDMFKGILKIENRNNFIVDKEVYYTFSFTDGNNQYSIYKKNILSSDLTNTYKIMPYKLYELVSKLMDYNKDNSRRANEASQFEMLKMIKDYSDEVDIVLNDRLRIEKTPIIVDKIKIDFNDNGEVLKLFPKFEEDESSNNIILNTINSYDEVKDTYSANINGENVRYVIKHKDTLNKIIENNVNIGEERLNILNGKSQLFEDENIDISDFGPRVTGIGYLSYKNSTSTVKTNDLDWLDNEVELPYIQGSNVEGDFERIVLKPNDKIKLQSILAEMNINGNNVSEVIFENESGKEVKLIMSRNDILQEIENISSRIKEPKDIKRKKDLEELIKLSDEYEEEDYIPYKGIYLEKGYYDIKEELKNQLELLNHKDEDDKTSKRRTLLIAENLDEEEYIEVDKIEKKKHIVEIPTSLKDGINLFDYQKDCLSALQELYLDSPVNGFLLCDDMGLGKTLQLLSFLAWLKERNEVTPSLIVAPTSLLNNWDSNPDGEIQKFFKENLFKTDRVVGTIDNNRVEKLKEMDIVFITYDSLRINNIALGKINWKVMICDEAQKIKNPKTMVTIAAKAQNADFKIICSATPIENTLEDLWTLVDYSKPGLLGSLKEFRNQYIQKNASNEELKDINDNLYSKIKDFYIRREKDILPKTLPSKKINIYKVKPTKEEMDTLERVKATEDYTISAIQKMLAICSHVDVLNQEPLSRRTIDQLILKSSKLKSLKSILEDIKEKEEKVIIFTRLKRVQKILYLAIEKWFNLECSIVNGEESNLNKRTKKINEFKNSKGFNVIILSPEVAGFGLTITEANHVIHYTRLWNPAKEDQSTDRVYRIGQTKDVTVHYPMISFTEEKNYVYNTVESYVNENVVKKEQALSPEEKLNILLARKKDMLLNFFLAAGNGDIGVNEFINLDDKIEETAYKDSISISDITNNLINSFEFEALVAVIYEKMGYTTYLTTKSNDNGIDVIACNNDEVLYIQCKHDKSNIGEDELSQINFAKESYKNIFKSKNDKCVIVTLESTLLKNLQDNYGIEIINIADLLDKHKVFMNEVTIKDKERYSYESLNNIFI